MEQQPSDYYFEQACLATFIDTNLRRTEWRDSFASFDDGLASGYMARRYEQWRETVDPDHAAEIESKAALLEQYDQFREPVQEVLTRLCQGDPAVNVLGIGRTATVIDMPANGQSYALRLIAPKGPRGPAAGLVNNRAAIARHTKNIPHAKHLQAVSFDTPLTISTILPGKPVSEALSGRRISQVTPEQVCQLIGTVLNLHGNRATADQKPAKLLYDPEHGFSCLDLVPINYVDYPSQHLRHLVRIALGQNPGASHSNRAARVALLERTWRMADEKFGPYISRIIGDVLLEAEIGAYPRRQSGSLCDRYFSSKEAEAARRSQPSVHAWLGAHATKAGVPERVLPSPTGHHLTGLRDQLLHIQTLIALPDSADCTAQISEAITDIEEILGGVQGHDIDNAKQILVAARGAITNALERISSAHSQISSYMGSLGML